MWARCRLFFVRPVFSSAIKMLSNLTWYYLQHCSAWRKKHKLEFELMNDTPYLTFTSKLCLLWEFLGKRLFLGHCSVFANPPFLKNFVLIMWGTLSLRLKGMCEFTFEWKLTLNIYIYTSIDFILIFVLCLLDLFSQSYLCLFQRSHFGGDPGSERVFQCYAGHTTALQVWTSAVCRGAFTALALPIC